MDKEFKTPTPTLFFFEEVITIPKPASSTMIQRSVNLDAALYRNIEQIAEKQHKTVSAVLRDALQFYVEAYFMDHTASFLNEEIVSIVCAIVRDESRGINNKTDQVLSSLAINEGVRANILASTLNFSTEEYDEIRADVVRGTKENQRFLNLRNLMK